MKGDLGSPLIRAMVRAERVKRGHGPNSPLWRRAITLRARLMLNMTPRELSQAMELVELDRRRNPHGVLS